MKLPLRFCGTVLENCVNLGVLHFLRTQQDCLGDATKVWQGLNQDILFWKKKTQTDLQDPEEFSGSKFVNDVQLSDYLCI